MERPCASAWVHHAPVEMIVTGAPLLSRRTLLAGATLGMTAAMLTAGLSGANAAAAGLRSATLDWALLETLLALGADVVAAPELRQYRDVAVAPAVPGNVADLGLRGSPSLETLHFARPDMIFNSNFYAWADPLMAPIAPVRSYAIYSPGESPYALAVKATRGMAADLGLATADTVIDAQTADFRGKAAVLSGRQRRPVLLLNLGDARHVRVFGADSMFGEILVRLGLKNAWDKPTAYSAMAPVGIETLATMPEATIVIIPPQPADALAELQSGAFWNALPAVRAGRVVSIGPVNPYGALPAAGRFADLLTGALQDGAHG